MVARRNEDAPCIPGCIYAPGHKTQARAGRLQPDECETSEQLRQGLNRLREALT